MEANKISRIAWIIGIVIAVLLILFCIYLKLQSEQSVEESQVIQNAQSVPEVKQDTPVQQDTSVQVTNAVTLLDSVIKNSGWIFIVGMATIIVFTLISNFYRDCF